MWVWEVNEESLGHPNKAALTLNNIDLLSFHSCADPDGGTGGPDSP